MAETYDLEEIQEGILGTREGNNYFLLAYPPKRRMTDVSRLIWDLKENQPQAIRALLDILLPQFYKWSRRLKGSLHCRHIIVIPGHKRGRRNAGCETLAAALCERFSWLQHLPNSLRRTKTVTKASRASSYRDRPKYADHIKSIRYFGPKLPKGNGILMLDDVFTTSETARACRDILKKRSGCRRVIGIFVGRTDYD